jgi:hypothetical protein
MYLILVHWAMFIRWIWVGVLMCPMSVHWVISIHWICVGSVMISAHWTMFVFCRQIPKLKFKIFFIISCHYDIRFAFIRAPLNAPISVSASCSEKIKGDLILMTCPSLLKITRADTNMSSSSTMKCASLGSGTLCAVPTPSATNSMPMNSPHPHAVAVGGAEVEQSSSLSLRYYYYSPSQQTGIRLQYLFYYCAKYCFGYITCD